MSYLLDTNVVSEWTKARPDANVARWIAESDEDRLFISVVALAEIRRGIERMPVGRRRDRLAAWLVEELPARFDQRIIGIDRAVAEHWGIIIARAQAAGDNMGTMDAFVAASAAVHRLTLVTRNTKDFVNAGVGLLNPWAAND